MTYSLRQIVLPPLLLLLNCVAVQAQNTKNNLRLDEKTFAWYSECFKNVFSYDNIAKADSVIRLAKAEHNVPKQVAGMHIMAYALFGNDMRDSSVTTLEAEKALCLKHIRMPGMRNFYYRVQHLIVNVSIMTDNKFLSYEVAQEMIHQSAIDHDVFGTYASYYSMGLVFSIRSNPTLAISYYEKAIEWSYKHNMKEEGPVWPLYLQIANCYLTKSQYLLAYDNARKAVDEAGAESEVAESYLLCFAFWAETPEQYVRHYEEATQNPRYALHTDGNIQLMTKINYLKAKGLYAEAMAVADSLGEDAVHQFRSDICGYFGEWKKAYDYAMLNEAYVDSIQGAMLVEDLANLDAQLDNAYLKEQTAKANLRSQYVLSGGVIVILAVILLFIIILYRNRERHVAQLMEMNKQLDAANKMKSRFIQNMTHEIRTPLNAIQGFSTLLADPEMLTAEERQGMANLVKNNTDKLTNIIDEMLDFGDMGGDTFSLSVAEFDVLDACNEALRIARPDLASGVDMVLESNLAEARVMNSDRRYLVKLLVQLLRNACQHTAAGRVTLTVSLKATNFEFAVADTGEGLDPKMRDAVFEDFVKVDEFKQGIGLGLTICKLIASNLRGQMSIDTEYCGGARFVFVAPCRL